MSELFESLHSRRVPAQSYGKVARRTARDDAVLATLGYAPARRGVSLRPFAVPLALAAALAFAAWVGWSLYSGSGAVTTTASRSTAQPVLTSRSARAVSAPAAPASAPPASSAASTHSSPPASPPPSTSTRATAAAPRNAPVTRVDRAAPKTPVSPATAQPAAAASTAFELALYYHRSGDFENALLHYRALLQQNELNAQAHNNLGLLYLEKNLLDDSTRELQRALIIDPRYGRAHNNYGVALLRQGKLDAAAAEFRILLALEPRNVDGLVNLALVEKAAGHPERAKESLLEALSIAPKGAAAHYNLAVLYDETGENARAADHYRSFLDTAGAEYADRAPAVRARIATLIR